MKPFSKEQQKEICDLYLKGAFLKDVASTFGISHKSVKDVLTANNIKVKRGKYDANENYFSELDSEEKNYWFGFIFADGSLNQEGGVRVELQRGDLNHLEKLKIALSYTGVIQETQHLTPAGNMNNYSALRVTRKKFYQDLINLGFSQNKTSNPEVPKIEEKYYKDFLAGFFDGDGCVSIFKRKKVFLHPC